MSLLKIIVAVAVIAFCSSIAIYTILDRILKYKESRLSFTEDCKSELERLEKYIYRVEKETKDVKSLVHHQKDCLDDFGEMIDDLKTEFDQICKEEAEK